MPARSRVIVAPGQVIGRKVVEFFPGLRQRHHGPADSGLPARAVAPWRDHENGIARGEYGITAGVRVDAAGPLVHDNVNPVVGPDLTHGPSGKRGLRSHRPHAIQNGGFTGCRSPVFSPAAQRRQFIAWGRKPQDVALPFPVPSPKRGDRRARPQLAPVAPTELEKAFFVVSPGPGADAPRL